MALLVIAYIEICIFTILCFQYRLPGKSLLLTNILKFFPIALGDHKSAGGNRVYLL